MGLRRRGAVGRMGARDRRSRTPSVFKFLISQPFVYFRIKIAIISSIFIDVTDIGHILADIRVN